MLGDTISLFPSSFSSPLQPFTHYFLLHHEHKERWLEYLTHPSNLVIMVIPISLYIYIYYPKGGGLELAVGSQSAVPGDEHQRTSSYEGQTEAPALIEETTDTFPSMTDDHEGQRSVSEIGQHIGQAITHKTLPSLVPDHVFVSSAGKAYDRDWMTRHDIDELLLQGFSNKHQLKTLMAGGAVKIGNRLQVTFDLNGVAVHREGSVSLN